MQNPLVSCNESRKNHSTRLPFWFVSISGIGSASVEKFTMQVCLRTGVTFHTASEYVIGKLVYKTVSFSISTPFSKSSEYINCLYFWTRYANSQWSFQGSFFPAIPIVYLFRTRSVIHILWWLLSNHEVALLLVEREKISL